MSSAPAQFQANIFTIPQTAPFLDCLARALLKGDLFGGAEQQHNPLNLTRITLLLPTRRACRSMREAFLRISDGQATLLPCIRPIGEGDEDASILSQAAFAKGDEALASIDVPPAIGAVERQLVLTELILKWSQTLNTQNGEADHSADITQTYAPETTPSQAVLLARELIRLMDEVETEQVDFSKLTDIVPEQFSEHWSMTLEFLKIITQMWPAFLQEQNLLSPSARRNILLAQEAETLRRLPPQAPIIAAGITGSIPAAADLLKVIAHLPQGYLVLPGLDMLLDKESWEVLSDHPEHPQHSMKKLLDHLEIERANIRLVPGIEPTAHHTHRLNFVSEVMRPAGTTDQWQGFLSKTKNNTDFQDSFKNISYIAAPSAEDEAEVVSLILRQAAETPGVTAALVTPDRILGRRVSTRLMKWGLLVDDSAGRPLTKTVPGVFMSLVANAIATGFEASALMSLLKHPLTRLGMKAGHIRAAARSLELILLRQPLTGQGFEALRNMLVHSRAAFERGELPYKHLRRLGQRDWDRTAVLLDALENAFAPWLHLYQEGERYSLKTLCEAHIAVAEALAVPAEQTSSRLWAGEAGEAMSLALAHFLQDTVPGPSLLPTEYPEFFQSLLTGEALRAQTAVHPRLFIWGPLEARLQQPDIVIVGGLNEGVWPQVAQGDPWLSRPMRSALGLPAPEQRIGLFAHDFAHVLGGAKIYLTRAAKVEGVPTVPSRWLLRLQALLNGLELDKALETSADEPWLAWARYRDRVEVRTPVEAPAPCPPVEKRPRQLSVTKIEDWIKNPYIIFARDILRLEPLPVLGVGPDAALRGQVIHQALHVFTKQYPEALPTETPERLVELAQQILADYAAHPQVAVFWKPRFERFAHWFAETEPARRDGVAKLLTERKGSFSFQAPAGPFTLTARADRLDLARDNTLIIYDYKTGYFPNDKDVTSLKAPQLPLEAAIAIYSGFEGVSKADVSALHYISASGGEPPGLEHKIACQDVGLLAENAIAKLQSLVAHFDQPETPYHAARYAQFDYRYDLYAHLARVAEWNSGV